MPLEPAVIAAAIADAPAWTLVSLTITDEQLRDAGALELARWIAAWIEPLPSAGEGQLLLPLSGNV